ncbi:MAG: hypothetical protein ABSF62_07150 [Bryobacteraceae bacterium]
MPNRPLVSGDLQPEEAQYEAGLRPRRLAEFTGQRTAVSKGAGVGALSGHRLQ